MKKRRGRKMSREKLFDKYRVEKGSKRQFQCKRCKAEWNIAGLFTKGAPRSDGEMGWLCPNRCNADVCGGDKAR